MDASPFRKLSPELRNHIWDLVLDSTAFLLINNPKSCAPPPITKVCRQIRTETLLMFYSDKVVQAILPSPVSVTKIYNLTVNIMNWANSVSRPCHDAIKRFEIHFARYGLRRMYCIESVISGRVRKENLSQQLAEFGYVGPEQYLCVHDYVAKWAGSVETARDLIEENLGEIMGFEAKLMPDWSELVENSG